MSSLRRVSFEHFHPEDGDVVPNVLILPPGGREVRIRKFWYEILLLTVESLVARGRLTPDVLPIRSGNQRYLVNKTPVSPNGSFKNPKAQSGYWVEAAHNRGDMMDHIRHMLEVCGSSPRDYYVGWFEP